ncbi:glycoside hydrolase family 95 protein [Winogradskyella psychrotolerans]|uniref:glycoside hydrolase family 95 protein n=1 Tax=Winogradskyella psychrotolerans TaxID=1344585 RepID=UPI001C0667A9|nr:glycoside hydrolase family 95 protein [Winogradskyella psychrotolerans]MBU2929887.1 glycoside hydrolase family 95 protein [Winogradskyella psychrotolerans]
MIKSNALLLLLCLVFFSGCKTTAQEASVNSGKPSKTLSLWYNEPAADSNKGWINSSIPMGNGYMGVNLFGGIEKERIQITENSLYDTDGDRGLRRRGLNNFAEVYIDFNHKKTTGYIRELNLNEGVSFVEYEQDGVQYSREYFTSYPDKVMAIRLSASKKGKLSFALRPTIPFIGEGKSGSVSAKEDVITLSGIMNHFKIKFEGQFKVIPKGGKMKTNKNGTINVSDADSAVILIAVGTNYQFDPQVFLTEDPSKKLEGFPDPHNKVSNYLENAAAKSYEELLANHQADYKELFDRVNFNLGAEVPTIPTNEMVDSYPEGPSSLYFEELAFQFGRYMLICSSRKGTLPPHLQGIWNVYERPPWSSQYLHDTNLQMAYAPVFSTNLSELFESYANYFKAFEPRQRDYATQYLKEYNESELDPNGDNGWSGPFWSNPYRVPGKSPVAGFGTGSWISLLFWDYFDFTQDKTLLAEEIYPILYDQANFVSRFVKNVDGVLLAEPSSSPEQKLRNTVGTTFDQQMFYENHHNTLKTAEILGRSDARLSIFESQLPLLDPIQIGKSGQIKEFRQEEYFDDIGDPNHRHTSMLLGLYPGQLINDKTPAWRDAAKVSLIKRSHKTNIGWARAERIAMWARVHDGEEAYSYYKELLSENYMHNLFNDHRGDPLFQADANYGATAGVAEMLMQSQDYVIAPLTALPKVWSDGSYRGLLARGNFEVSAKWSDGQADTFEVLSKSGGMLKLRYPNVSKASIKTSDGQKVEFNTKGNDQISMQTLKGQTYVITAIPEYVPVSAPSNLKIQSNPNENEIKLSWETSKDAKSYNVYRAVGNAPDYELVVSEMVGANYVYKSENVKQFNQITFKVTAVRDDGRESDKGITVIWLKP